MPSVCRQMPRIIAGLVFGWAVGGSSVTADRPERKPAQEELTQTFERKVAPILANRCLECHDSLNRKGGLDLSRRDATRRGGESGPVIDAGDVGESLLWLTVESDEMPLDRDPLTDAEKQILREWIESGATYSIDTIDPAVYVHGGQPGANYLRRLTVSEYVATVQSIFGIDVSDQARQWLPRDVRADGFSNTAYNMNVDLKHIEAYARLAEFVVSKLDAMGFARQFEKNLTFTDKSMGRLIKGMGRRVYRGPLKQDEVVLLRGIATTVAATDGGTLEEAVELILEAMLQSPRFLYRVEGLEQRGSEDQLTDFELASRISFILWGGPPDERLLKAADDDRLGNRKTVGRQAERMLKDSRAIAQSRRFIADWLNLNRLSNLQPDPEWFPDWDPALADDMRRETLAFFEDVVWQQQRPLSELLNADVTFVTPRLAKHYGLPDEAARVSESDGELIRYDLSKTDSRGGLLTQGSLLTIGGDEASTVTRGLLVMHELLRGVVKDPPPCVDTTPIPSKPGLSQRSIAEDRIANEACGGCHARFEPLAFGLERYDGLGGYHETDRHGNVLRQDGVVQIPGSLQPLSYQTSDEMMDLMAASQRVKETLTWKLTQYAIGRPLTAADVSQVRGIHKRAQANGGTYQATMKALVTSDLVLTR